jgi:hypothetical protein
MSSIEESHVCYWLVVAGCLIVGFSIGTNFGCNEAQRQEVDAIVADVNTVTVGARALLQSPAGQAIPTPVKEIAGLVVGLLGGGVATWTEWRRRTMAKTTKAIVRGIEQVDREHRAANPENPAKEIKDRIGANMLALGVRDRGNKIIDRLKIS